MYYFNTFIFYCKLKCINYRTIDSFRFKKYFSLQCTHWKNLNKNWDKKQGQRCKETNTSLMATEFITVLTHQNNVCFIQYLLSILYPIITWQNHKINIKSLMIDGSKKIIVPWNRIKNALPTYPRYCIVFA